MLLDRYLYRREERRKKGSRVFYSREYTNLYVSYAMHKRMTRIVKSKDTAAALSGLTRYAFDSRRRRNDYRIRRVRYNVKIQLRRYSSNFLAYKGFEEAKETKEMRRYASNNYVPIYSNLFTHCEENETFLFVPTKVRGVSER